MTKQKLIKVELALSVLIFVFGFLIDFTPLLSDGETWSLLIAGVNNSPWESFKPFMLSFMFFSVLELGGIRLSLAKFIKVYVTCLYIYTLAGLFSATLYGGMFPYNILYYTAVFIAGLLCRLVAANRMFSAKETGLPLYFFLTALVLYILMFLFFTPYPPHVPLFFDSAAGKYGF